MVDVLVQVASGGSTVAGSSPTKLTGCGPIEQFPSGPPARWNNGSQRFDVATGEDGVYDVSLLLSSPQTSGWLMGRVIVNGTTAYHLVRADAPSAGPIVGGSRRVRLAAGDYVEVQAAQGSGSSQTVTVADLTFRWLHA